MKTECQTDTVQFREKSYPCTVSLAMDLIGGKWKAVILYHLQKDAKRYSMLRKEMPAITEMTLSLQLKQLEHDGLVKRKVKGTKPPIEVHYSLTPFGMTLLPLLQAITEWGNKAATDGGTF